MNFGRILNIFIILFLIANIVLFFGYQYKKEQAYTITTEKEEQLKDILGNNNIYIYCLLPKYEPRSKLSVKLKEVDDQLPSYLFGSLYNYKPLPPEYSKDNETIIMVKGTKEGLISYTNSSAMNELGDFTKDKIEKFGNTLMNRLTMEKGNMRLTSSQPDDDYNYYQLEYNDVYKKEIIFSNYVQLMIYKSGRVEGKSIRYEPISFNGRKEKITPVDEVLYRFMYNIRRKENNELIKIMGIDIGYYVDRDDDDRSEDKDDLEAVPCYRIRLGSGEVHYINAYTNKEISYV